MSLGTPVRRSEFWRYAKVWLDGGIYSDIDIGATARTTDFFRSLDYEKVRMGTRTRGGVVSVRRGMLHALIALRGQGR